MSRTFPSVIQLIFAIMRAYITTWLKISEHNKAFSKRDTQAISVADLLWLIYIFVYNICTCARLSDPPREVSLILALRILMQRIYLILILLRPPNQTTKRTSKSFTQCLRSKRSKCTWIACWPSGSSRYSYMNIFIYHIRQLWLHNNMLNMYTYSFQGSWGAFWTFLVDP